MTTATAAPAHIRGDEWDLVELAKQGDAAAYAQLYEKYRHPVFKFTLFRLQDRHLAEDLTSETFLRALRRISSVNYMGRDVGAWFITIARNLVLDELKCSRVRREFTCGEILDTEENSIVTHQNIFGGDPMHLTVNDMVAREVRRCVALLNPDWQRVINLRFFEGQSVTETALAMNRPETAVKALQHRALRGLAKRLPKEIW